MVYKDCNRCKHELKDSNESPCDECGNEREGYEPKTNADRIRNMTDEELAELLINDTYCTEASDCQDSCAKCILEWLQAELKEGNSNENT